MRFSLRLGSGSSSPCRTRQRGSAMLVTLIIISALLAGAAVLVSMQISSSRSSDLSRTGMTATYCAEAGLSAARPVVASHYSSWAGSFYTGGTITEPSWLSSGIGSHDLDGDGSADFIVYLVDNDDETPNDKSKDNDLRTFIVSKCIKYPDTPKAVEELVEFKGGGTCYQSQEGGCSGNGNSN